MFSAVELLICKAPASQGKEAANFSYGHSSTSYVCIQIFLLRVRYSTFGISVPPKQPQDTCPFATPSDYMVWQHPMQKAVSAERRAGAPAWKHNWGRDVPGTGTVLPSQADMNLRSIQLIRVSWLLTKRGTGSSPSIQVVWQSQLSCSQMSFYLNCSLS